MKLVYVAAPYTGKTHLDVEKNILRARIMGAELARAGFAPAIPQANTALYEFIPNCGDAQFWYDATMELMLRCDAVLFFGASVSKGVRGELVRAHAEGIFTVGVDADPLNGVGDVVSAIDTLKEYFDDQD